LPFSSFASGLISASVRSYSRKSCISWNTMGVSRTRSSPVTPTCATASFAMRSVSGSSVEKCVRERCSGCCSATSSMSMPPMSLNSSTGSLARPSHVTEAKYSFATGHFSSTSTQRAFSPLTTIGSTCWVRRTASSGVSANCTAPAFMRPPESTWLFTTTGPPISAAAARASSALATTRPRPSGRPRRRNSALDSYS
jgi:hypothetical protein